MKTLSRYLLLFLMSISHAQAGSSWWQSSVFYEIFVRSFQDTNGDGIGDLNGVSSRLDYIQNLGADAIWLMPIFSSPSYHGYDAIDYRAINPDYGTLADFQNLITKAHARGMRVILDLAINHTSDRNAAFTEGLINPSSPLESWYLWTDKPTVPWVGKGSFNEVSPGRYYYTTFSPNMPDLNWHNPDVRAEIKSILHYWSQMGVDGFRLDAARYYVKGPEGQSDTPGTHQAIQDFVQDLKQNYPNVFFVGEVWADAQTIAPYVSNGLELDTAFNFPVSSGLIASLEKELGSDLVSALKDVQNQIGDAHFLAPFITNHDMQRVATRVQGDVAKLKLAAAVLMTLPGTPFVYYGEEIGMPNGPTQDDRDKRTPMQWDTSNGFGFTTGSPWKSFATTEGSVSVSAEMADPNSVLSTYRSWIATRQAHLALKQGGFQLLSITDPALVIYERTSPSETLLVALNLSAQMTPPRAATVGGQSLQIPSLGPLSANLYSLNGGKKLKKLR